MSYFIKTATNNTPLNDIRDGEFCMGLGCFDFRYNCYATFKTILEAKEYLDYKKDLLNNWINIEIPKQANMFADRQNFIYKNTKFHISILRKIDKLVIEKIR